ncbi:voltage-gated ion channel superfamily [Plasmopara halstedii]|uniref:Voltage-gated ion channel superfamily n=1 Tax=Plasmopara halstedii TaxID=4781 RepID=A0A0P1AKA4_PLAHL|nr:voltage-gated ion channel superfamily [Plasmopara halstedii]CEG41046.1 voltage-gated ion channel superfamily [Plasmopara halstedii]|eukprot:XP_024577415.1 voltage-gated ion channel superfamily [Plasmopara halstedii]
MNCDVVDTVQQRDPPQLEQVNMNLSDRLNLIEDRLEQFQIETHQMLRDLNTLIQRQHKSTLSKNKSRNVNERGSPKGLNVFRNGPLVGTTGATEALRLVPPEIPKAINSALDAFTATATNPSNSAASKKVMNTNLTSVPETLQNSFEVSAESDQQPTPLQRRIMKLAHSGKLKAERSSRENDEVFRTFSVSSMNLAQKVSTIKKRKNNLFDEKSRNATVSPEQILSARNLEGTVHPYSIRHDSQKRSVWDVFVMLLIVLDLVFTPLSLGFNYKSEILDGFNILEPVVFTIDFFVRMFSTYVDEHGDLISGPTHTVKNYIVSGWAIPDFISWFPFGALANINHGDALGFTKIFRLTKVTHLAYRLHSTKKAGVLRFVLLLALVLVIAHSLACYWSFVAVEWRAHLDEGPFLPKTLFDEYTLCWSLVIGCVNASPPIMYSPIELISVACFMLVGNILQASVFGAVAALISSIDEDEAAFGKKITTTTERCRFLGIPEDLAKRIRGYYEHLWRETKSVSADADGFINELSPALICEVKFQLYRDMLQRIPFLSAKTLDPAVIEVLVLHLRTVIYMQDDVLIRKGEFGDWMGFIGSKGSVGVLDPNSENCKIMCILRKGDYFGEMALLQYTKRSATTVALTWVQIHVLCRQDLDNVKEMYPIQAGILEKEITKYKYMTSGTERW